MDSKAIQSFGRPACGLTCQGRAECERLSRGGVGPYGRVVRVNSRLDRVLGFELHTIRGLAKMQLRVGLALVVMLSMALGRIRANQQELMRSPTAPVRAA